MPDGPPPGPAPGGAAGGFDDPFADFVEGDFLDDRWDLLGDQARPAGGLAGDRRGDRDERGSGTGWVVAALVLLLAGGGVTALLLTGVIDREALLADLGLGDDDVPGEDAPEDADVLEPIDLAEGPGVDALPDPPPSAPATEPQNPIEPGGGLWGILATVFGNRGEDPPAPRAPEVVDVSAPPPVPSGPPLRDSRERPVDFVSQYLRSGPTPQAAYTEANRHLEAGDAEVALLMFEHGADQGHGPSIIAIGRMYDPVHFAPSLSAFTHANPVRAAERYTEAASQGSPEAAQALADLRGWLEDAAAGGDQEAQAALSQLAPLP